MIRMPEIVYNAGMETIVVYAHAISKALVQAAAPNREVVMADTTRGLVESIVYEKDVVSVVVELDGADREEAKFLRSFVRLFPTIVVTVVADPGDLPFKLPPQTVLVPIVQSEEEIVSGLSSAIIPRVHPNRRKFNRFDWPLQAVLGPDPLGDPRHRIRALSAGGAFLEHSGANPTPGSHETITIRFGNFALTVQCEILDARQASSVLPQGFGIRFLDLSAATERIIERIVNDALVEVLLGEEEEPEIPSLDEKALSFSVQGEITLC